MRRGGAPAAAAAARKLVCQAPDELLVATYTRYLSGIGFFPPPPAADK
jgi:hypothetical protein